MRTSLLILLLTVAISVTVPASKLYAYGGGGGGGSGHGTLGDRQESSIGERAGFVLMNDLPLGIGCGWGVGVVGHPGTVGAGVNPPDAPESGNKNIDRDVLEFVMLLVAIEAGAYPTGDIIVSDEAIDKLDELFGDKKQNTTTRSANTREDYPGVSFRVDQIDENVKKFSGVTENTRITVYERKFPNGTVLTEKEHKPRNVDLSNFDKVVHRATWEDVYTPGVMNHTYQKGRHYQHIKEWENGRKVTETRRPGRHEFTYEYPEGSPVKLNNKHVKKVIEIPNSRTRKYEQTITYTDGTKETRESRESFGVHPVGWNKQLESIKRNK